MSTSKTVTKKTSTNGWTEENSAKAVELYTAALGDKSDTNILEANSSENLTAIMEATGAKSIAAVRSKLTTEKVYMKPSVPRKVGGGAVIRKQHFVRALAAKAIADGVIEEADEFDSLEHAKAPALKALAEMLGVTVTA